MAVCVCRYDLLAPRALGMVGLVMFWQEFYGTAIYFLSYFMNRRHVGRGVAEVVLFVGGSNGLWFVFPAIGMVACARVIESGSFDVFRA